MAEVTASVCPLWRKFLDSNSADMCSPTRIGPWTDSISVIHGRSASTSSYSWFGFPTCMLMTLRSTVS